MKKLFLHVGPHKTGTTAIQKFMLDNAKQCFKQNLVYPKRHLHIFGQHKFRELIVNKSIDAETIEFFKNNEHNFVLSSEDFISLNEEQFKYLRQKLDGIHIIVIFSWRRASFKLFSIWQEVIKHGGTIDFFQYYHEHLARPALSQMLSPDLKLNMLSRVFGKDNIKVIDYEASASQKRLYQDFVSACEINWSDTFNVQAIDENAKNASMELIDVEIVRALNQLMLERFSYSGSTVRIAFSKFKGHLNPGLLKQLRENISGHVIDLKIGNYFIDSRAEKVMQDLYSQQMSNFQMNTDTRLLKIVSSEWLLNVNTGNLIERIGDELHKLMVNENIR